MTDSAERWLPVVGWEGLYEVSDFGRVRSLPRKAGTRILEGQIRALADNGKGYMQVTLCNRKKQKRFVHQLVVEAFIGPREPGVDCCHRDGDRANNRLPNLRYDTRAGNEAGKVRHGTHSRGERHGMSKLTARAVVAIRGDTRLHREIAAEYGIAASRVSQIKSQKAWAHIQ